MCVLFLPAIRTHVISMTLCCQSLSDMLIKSLMYIGGLFFVSTAIIREYLPAIPTPPPLFFFFQLSQLCSTSRECSTRLTEKTANSLSLKWKKQQMVRKRYQNEYYLLQSRLAVSVSIYSSLARTSARPDWLWWCWRSMLTAQILESALKTNIYARARFTAKVR